MRDKHKWLGLTWTVSLSFQDTLSHRAALAGAVWGLICGLLRNRTIPIDIALSLFCSKVLPTLLQGASMYGLDEQTETSLSLLQDAWARRAFGLESWRNAAVASSELGWKSPLHLEVVLAVAMRHFRLWQLPDDDMYKTRFMWSHRLKQSWADQSLSLIHFWGLVDWVEWKADTFGYKKYARRRLEEICFPGWLQTAQASMQPPAYTSFQEVHSLIPEIAAALHLDWETRLNVFAFCKLRAGGMQFAALNGRRSRAKIQQCIFCQTRTRAARVHVLASCLAWQHHRQSVGMRLGLDFSDPPANVCRKILSCHPTSPAFRIVALWAADLDRGCVDFWAVRDSKQYGHAAVHLVLTMAFRLNTHVARGYCFK